MRALMTASVLALAALPLAPLWAQDHSGHRPMSAPTPSPTPAPTPTPIPAPTPSSSEEDPHKNHRMGPPAAAAATEPAPAESPAADPMVKNPMDHGGMDHSGMDHSAMGVIAPQPDGSPPARAQDGPRYAADAVWGKQAMASSRKQLAKENGGMTTGVLLVERLEARISGDSEAYLWDIQGWYGGDLTRVFLKSEGEGAFGGDLESGEIQVLFSRAIGPFFDLQAGARIDIEPDTRSHLVLGVQGLAPYWLHVDGALFLSDQGDLTARLEGEYDQKLTQRLILQPRVEVEFSAQDIAAREIGAGLTKLETGIRLRYEFAREFAPYIGLGYEAKLGETATIARRQGEDADGFAVLIGLRTWF